MTCDTRHTGDRYSARQMTRTAPRRFLGLLSLLVVLGVLWSGAAAEAQGGDDGCPVFARADAEERLGSKLEGPVVWGRLCQVVDGEAVFPAGVRITASAGGREVAEAATDEVGFFLVELAEPGTYTVTVDEATLPDGVALTDEDRAALTADIQRPRRATFRLGDAPAADRDLSRYLVAAGKGLRTGLVLAVAAVGLSLVFGVTGLVNFSHAEMVTIGAIAAYLLEQAGVPFWLALPLAAVIGGLVGWSSDRLLWRPLRKRRLALLSMMVVSIGLATAVRSILQVWFGPSTRRYSAASGQTESAYGPFRYTTNDLRCMAVAVVVLLAVTYLLRRTRIGTAMRAVADNPDLAASSGIAVDKVISVVWFLSGALAAIGGSLYALTINVEYRTGFLILLSMFAAVVLGGLGNAYGAVLGAIVIGVVQETSALVVDPAYKFVAALVVLILVLLVRPQGLLGQRERFG